MSGASTSRPYRMAQRAETLAATRRAILEAAVELGDPRLPLSATATRAGVSERTVLRHFGSRDGLVAAAIREAHVRSEEERFAVPVGDVAAAIANLVAFYDARGDVVLRLLAEEGTDERIDEILATGREMHRRWVVEKLGPRLDVADGRTRRRRIAQLVAVCDIYFWKLLRRDYGFGRSETERAIRELVGAAIDSKEGTPR